MIVVIHKKDVLMIELNVMIIVYAQPIFAVIGGVVNIHKYIVMMRMLVLMTLVMRRLEIVFIPQCVVMIIMIVLVNGAILLPECVNPKLLTVMITMLALKMVVIENLDVGILRLLVNITHVGNLLVIVRRDVFIQK